MRSWSLGATRRSPSSRVPGRPRPIAWFSTYMSGLDGLGALVEEPNAPRALLPLLADHGQVRPLDEIKGEVIRFAPAHSGRRLFKAARRRVIGRSTLDRKLETLEIAASAHHDASSVAVR